MPSRLGNLSVVVAKDLIRRSVVEHRQTGNFRLYRTDPREEAVDIEPRAGTGGVQHRYLGIMLAGGKTVCPPLSVPSRATRMRVLIIVIGGLLCAQPDELPVRGRGISMC
jgi:hypothetical protein